VSAFCSFLDGLLYEKDVVDGLLRFPHGDLHYMAAWPARR
jgi:hypothetical protein